MSMAITNRYLRRNMTSPHVVHTCDYYVTAEQIIITSSNQYEILRLCKFILIMCHAKRILTSKFHIVEWNRY